MSIYPEEPLITPEKLAQILEDNSISKEFYLPLVRQSEFGELKYEVFSSTQFVQCIRPAGDSLNMSLESFNALNWYLHTYTPIKPFLNLDEGLLSHYSATRTEKIGKVLTVTSEKDQNIMTERFQVLENQVAIGSAAGDNTDVSKVQHMYERTPEPGYNRVQPSFTEIFANMCLQSKGFELRLVRLDISSSWGMKFSKVCLDPSGW